MNLRAAITACLPAVLTLTACGPVEENPGPPGGVVYVAPPLEPRRNSSPSPDVHRWLEASASVRAQLASLRGELAGLQQLHVENHFDDFLALDPDTLEPGQLYYLHHFLERGYFRIEREILIQLLESRRARAATSAPAQPAPADIAARLQAGLQRFQMWASRQRCTAGSCLSTGSRSSRWSMITVTCARPSAIWPPKWTTRSKTKSFER